ncbi:MAG: hypothetical protein KC466_06970, partial [Myxococcales bacterium]|nr:hypothetical protein [Myxococcales bacterium]
TLAVLVGIGFEPLLRVAANRVRALGDGAPASPVHGRVVAVVLGVLLADVGMSSFFRHPREVWDGRKDAAYAALTEAAHAREGKADFFRALDLTSPTSITNSTLAGNTILPVLAGVASVYGDVPWASPKSFPYLSESIIELTEAYAETGTLTPAQHDLARLLNVAYLITGPARIAGAGGVPWTRSPVDGDEALTVVPDVAPLIASRRVEAAGERWAPDPTARWWEYYTTDLRALRQLGPDKLAHMADYMGMRVEDLGETPWRETRPMTEMAARMGIGSDGATAERLLSRTETNLAAGIAPGPPPKLRVGANRLTSTRIEITYETDGPAVVRIPRSYHPNTRVEVDGRPAAFAESADGMILARVPEGAHQLVARATLSPLRKACAAVSALSLGLLAALPLVLRRRA